MIHLALIGGVLLFPNELREEENLATDDIVVFLLFCASLLTVCVCGIFTAIRLWRIYAFCRKNRPLTNVSLTPVKVQTTVTTILILSWAIATPVCSVLYALPNFNFYVLRALLYLLFIVGAVFTWRVVSFRCIWKTLSALDAILQKNAVSRDRMLFNAIRLLGYLGVTFYMAIFWTFMIPDSIDGWTLYWSLIGHFGSVTCLCGAVLLLKANARLRLLEQTY